jgi:hypothetical protein
LVIVHWFPSRRRKEIHSIIVTAFHLTNVTGCGTLPVVLSDADYLMVAQAAAARRATM